MVVTNFGARRKSDRLVDNFWRSATVFLSRKPCFLLAFRYLSEHFKMVYWLKKVTLDNKIKNKLAESKNEIYYAQKNLQDYEEEMQLTITPPMATKVLITVNLT
jgi:hypothetical protein